MANSPYFSIITPTYNRVGFLSEMIRSVQTQTFREFEHIIVDDGSTDSTEELVASFIKDDPRIIYIKQVNKGRSTARNVGIDRAKGEYICFLDSDDLWKPEHLLVISKAVNGLDRPTFAFTGLQYRFPDRVETRTFPPIGEEKPIDYVIGKIVSTITVAIHHTILSDERFNPALSINEDLELWARIVAQHPMLRIDSTTAIAVQHGANNRDATYDHVAREAEAMKLVFGNPQLRPYYSNAFRKMKKKSLHELSIRHLEEIGDRWQLVFQLLRFLILYPRNPRNKAKIVALFYNLPGGSLIKRMLGSE